MTDQGIRLIFYSPTESGDAAAPIDPGLARLIDDFKGAVRTAVDLLVQSGIPRPHRQLAWVVTWVKQSGTLKGGVRYFKHGFGCRVWLPSGDVDFDFGAHGEIDQFDCYRLYDFARDRLAQYGFADEHGLREAYRAAHQSGAIKYAEREYNAPVPPSAEDQDMRLRIKNGPSRSQRRG